MIEFVFDRVENIVGKRKTAGKLMVAPIMKLVLDKVENNEGKKGENADNQH